MTTSQRNGNCNDEYLRNEPWYRPTCRQSGYDAGTTKGPLHGH